MYPVKFNRRPSLEMSPHPPKEAEGPLIDAALAAADEIATLIRQRPDYDARANLEMVQAALAEYKRGDVDGYMEYVHETDFKGSILSGLVPGGENICSRQQLVDFMSKVEEYVEVRKFEDKDWAAVGNTVYFTVEWEIKLRGSDRWITTEANVRKVVRDGKICEKYHFVDTARIQQLSFC